MTSRQTVGFYSPATKIASAYSEDKLLTGVRRDMRTMTNPEVAAKYFGASPFPYTTLRNFCKRYSIPFKKYSHGHGLPPSVRCGERAMSKVYRPKKVTP